MGIIQSVKGVKPVSNWRYWYRKWSFWIIGMIPTISAVQLFMPDIEYLFPPQTFLYVKGALAVLGFVASQIKQQAIEVPPNPPVPPEQETDK